FPSALVHPRLHAAPHATPPVPIRCPSHLSARAPSASKFSSQGHPPTTQGSLPWPDQLPPGCGPSARSDEPHLLHFDPIPVIRRSWQFPQSASRRLLEPRPGCSSRCSSTSVSTSACALRPTRVDGVGEAEVGVHERGLAVLAAHDHHVAHYAAT